MTAPEWLTRRGGVVEKGHAGNAWFVIFDNQVQYRLVSVPMGGQFNCAITQTVNGKRLSCDSRVNSSEEAIAVGLEDLRKALGWGG